VRSKTRRTVREQKNLDPDIDEIYYWAYFADYFSPWKDFVISEDEVEGGSPLLGWGLS
jgi:hypothetical protein